MRPRFNNHNNNGHNNTHKGVTADIFFSTRITYQSSWVKEQASEEFVIFAEKAGKFMAENKLTNSKIRSIYGEIKRIQMAKDFNTEKASFYLLKPKVAYALGRDKNNEGLKLFKLIFDRASKDVIDKKSYNNFCNLIEAILAYHKANGGD